MRPLLRRYSAPRHLDVALSWWLPLAQARWTFPNQRPFSSPHPPCPPEGLLLHSRDSCVCLFHVILFFQGHGPNEWHPSFHV